VSETEFGLSPLVAPFRPNLFIDISENLEEKLQVLAIYAGEMTAFPFPRSEVTVRALAQWRGSQCGCHAAEAFMTIKEIL
jgi:LmbE family N-acetylglucosaminyl deacetylase